MERRRARHGPLQAFSAIPWLIRCFFTTPNRRQQHRKQEIHLRETEPKRADGGDLIEISKLRGVVSVTTRHASQSQEVHREEGDVERNQRRPEVHFGAQ